MVGPGIRTQDLSDEILAPYRSELSRQPYDNEVKTRISSFACMFLITLCCSFDVEMKLGNDNCFPYVNMDAENLLGPNALCNPNKVVCRLLHKSSDPSMFDLKPSFNVLWNLLIFPFDW